MSSAFTPDVALLSLFQRNASARPDARALSDASIALTYTETSNAVANLAQQIASFGLPGQSSIALLFPNGNELAISLLAVMQSGHIPVPMPVAWRKSDLVRACREAEAAALITTAHFAPENLPELAAEVAIEVFELSFPCAFGAPLPDGIMPLALSTVENETKFAGPASQGIATMQPASGGASFILHRDEELLAAGLGAMVSADVQSGDNIVSAVSLSNFAGLASAFVPWMLSGGTLTLLPDISETAIRSINDKTHFVAAAGACGPICKEIQTPLSSVTAVHFSGTMLAADFSAIDARRFVDVIAINEVCAVALPRANAAVPEPLPLGSVHAGNTGVGSPVILETDVSESGNLLVRGALVPKVALENQAWCDTGYTAVSSEPSGFHAQRPRDLIAIGALRFSFPELERRILSAALVGSVEIVSDDVLGNRLVISSERPEETARALIDAGLPRVIANAVQKAETQRARSA